MTLHYLFLAGEVLPVEQHVLTSDVWCGVVPGLHSQDFLRQVLCW